MRAPTIQPTEGGGFTVRVRHPLTGVRVVVTRPTRGEVEHVLQEFEALRRRKSLGVLSEADRLAARRLDAGRLTLREVGERDLAARMPRLAARYRVAWESMIWPTLGAATLVCELTGTRMDTWLRELRTEARDGEGYALDSCRWAWGLLASALGRCIRDRLLDVMPWGEWGIPRQREMTRPAVTDPDDARALLLAAIEHDRVRLDGGVFSDLFPRIAFAVLVGQRQGELAALSWGDVDERAETITTSRQAVRDWRRWARLDGPDGDARPAAPTKTKRTRKASLSRDALFVLAWQRAQLQRVGWYRDDGPIFPGRSGAWRTRPGILTTAQVRRLAQAAGIASWRAIVPHSLRHSFVTLEHKGNGGDIRTTALRSGHEDVHALLRYLHAWTSGLARSSVPSILDASLEVPELPAAAPRALLPAPAEARPMPDRARGIVFDFGAAYRAWVDGGRVGPYPAAVALECNRVSSRVYAAARKLELRDAAAVLRVPGAPGAVVMALRHLGRSGSPAAYEHARRAAAEAGDAGAEALRVLGELHERAKERARARASEARSRFLASWTRYAVRQGKREAAGEADARAVDLLVTNTRPEALLYAEQVPEALPAWPPADLDEAPRVEPLPRCAYGTTCTRPPRPGRVLCDEHADAQRERDLAKRSARLREGTCADCGRAPAERGRVRCAACAQKHRAANR